MRQARTAQQPLELSLAAAELLAGMLQPQVKGRQLPQCCRMVAQTWVWLPHWSHLLLLPSGSPSDCCFPCPLQPDPTSPGQLSHSSTHSCSYGCQVPGTSIPGIPVVPVRGVCTPGVPILVSPSLVSPFP